MADIKFDFTEEEIKSLQSKLSEGYKNIILKDKEGNIVYTGSLESLLNQLREQEIKFPFISLESIPSPPDKTFFPISKIVKIEEAEKAYRDFQTEERLRKINFKQIALRMFSTEKAKGIDFPFDIKDYNNAITQIIQKYPNIKYEDFPESIRNNWQVFTSLVYEASKLSNLPTLQAFDVIARKEYYRNLPDVLKTFKNLAVGLIYPVVSKVYLGMRIIEPKVFKEVGRELEQEYLTAYMEQPIPTTMGTILGSLGEVVLLNKIITPIVRPISKAILSQFSNTFGIKITPMMDAFVRGSIITGLNEIA
ncbi:MAG: hypothetical protein NZ826_07915, partial [Thermodesulfovibrio sp.]|nr:hypothetical protein [Thermodesulfovibrio sp.]